LKKRAKSVNAKSLSGRNPREDRGSFPGQGVAADRERFGKCQPFDLLRTGERERGTRKRGGRGGGIFKRRSTEQFGGEGGEYGGMELNLEDQRVTEGRIGFKKRERKVPFE